MDFSTLTAAVEPTVIVAGITALAAAKMAPGVARWGYGKVISWFR
jgi:hypothetical protein